MNQLHCHLILHNLHPAFYPSPVLNDFTIDVSLSLNDNVRKNASLLEGLRLFNDRGDVTGEPSGIYRAHVKISRIWRRDEKTSEGENELDKQVACVIFDAIMI